MTDSPTDGRDADLVGTSPATLVERRRRGAGWVAVGMAVANGLGYLLNLVASRMLGPTDFGALGALLGLVLIGNVVALGLQTVTARVLAEDRSDADVNARRLYRLAAASALALGLVTAAVTPALAAVLHLTDATPVWLLAPVLLALTLTGGQLGLLQGGEYFRALAAMYVVAAVGKVGGGLLGVVIGGTVTATILGTAIGAALSATTGHLVVRGVRPRPARSGTVQRAQVSELAWAVYALLGFFALTNVDVLLARHYLDGPEAGLYAVGAVVAKGAFWLPGFVAVVALPALSDRTRRRRAAARAVAAVAACGVVVTVATAAMGGLVVTIVAGSAYSELAPEVWLFAAAGSLFALGQLMLFSRLAATDRRAVAVVWAAFGLLLALVMTRWHDSVTDIIGCVLVCSVSLVVAGAVAELHEHGHPAARRRASRQDAGSAGHSSGW